MPLAAIIGLFWSYAAIAQDAPTEDKFGELKVALDTLWVAVAAFLVFFMNAGFALVESGFCRRKN
ncbi:MAG TPA: ammonium transporter, partial [Cyanobacteria bacterium UBA8156]|nr:ammonium transporter [Cyanobacteria bacterium UBA8156]